MRPPRLVRPDTWSGAWPQPGRDLARILLLYYATTGSTSPQSNARNTLADFELIFADCEEALGVLCARGKSSARAYTRETLTRYFQLPPVTRRAVRQSASLWA